MSDGEMRFQYRDAKEAGETFVRQMEQGLDLDHTCIAGSIRRRERTVGDIEIVTMPKIARDMPNLFGETTREVNLLEERVQDLINASQVTLRTNAIGMVANGPRHKRLVYGETWPVDLFIVHDLRQLPLILAIRTGPALFSKRLVTPRAKGGYLPDNWRVRNGYLWNVCDVDTMAGPHHTQSEPISFESERSLFEQVFGQWIEPEERRKWA